MSDHTLLDLERDVEVTRARLARNLSALRSPSTLSDFSGAVKQEALGTKDALLEQARSSAVSRARSVVDDIKARAAANPAFPGGPEAGLSVATDSLPGLTPSYSSAWTRSHRATRAEIAPSAESARM